MKKINLKLIVLFAATIALLVFLHFLGALAPVEKGVYFIFNPAAARLQGWSRAFRLNWAWYGHQRDLTEENKALKIRVEELTVANASFKKVEEENSNLRQHLKFLENGGEKKYLLANIISRGVESGSEGRGDMIIDKGKADGVLPGLIVLDERGAVAGKITAVEEKISRFAPLTNSACKLAASLTGGGKTSGMAVGNFGLTVNLDYIPQAEKIAAGELVVTSGLEENIPRGLVIGQVEKVAKSGNDIWQSATVQPLADFENLLIVSVIIP
jgi:rod shape-determining protein MreC